MAIRVGTDKNVQVTALELTEHKIGSCSLAMVDAGGPESLTLADVAAALGVSIEDLSPLAQDKGDLLDLACDQIYAKIDIHTKAENWAERFRDYARSFRTALLEHPNALYPMATRPILHESSMKVAERALSELAGVGFDSESANRILIVIVSFVLGHALTEAGPSHQSVRGLPEIDDKKIKGFRRSLPTDLLPISAEALAIDNDRDAEFELGLKLIIDGLERQILHA